MENNAISKVFADVAVLLQAKGENVFKVRAHSKASDQIKSLPYSIAEIADDTDRLREIPGFGDAIVQKTQELVRTGRIAMSRGGTGSGFGCSSRSRRTTQDRDGGTDRRIRTADHPADDPDQ